MEETPRRLSFGAHAQAYERARPEWPAATARWFVPDDARLVVELGAGTGKLTRALAPLEARVVAVEPDLRMLAVLRERGLDGMPGSAEEIPLGDGEADVVVAGSSFHWFDLARALPEIHRVLRPRGRLAFGWNHRDDENPVGARVQAVISAARTGPRRPSPLVFRHRRTAGRGTSTARGGGRCRARSRRSCPPRLRCRRLPRNPHLAAGCGSRARRSRHPRRGERRRQPS